MQLQHQMTSISYEILQNTDSTVRLRFQGGDWKVAMPAIDMEEALFVHGKKYKGRQGTGRFAKGLWLEKKDRKDLAEEKHWQMRVL